MTDIKFTSYTVKTEKGIIGNDNRREIYKIAKAKSKNSVTAIYGWPYDFSGARLLGYYVDGFYYDKIELQK